MTSLFLIVALLAPSPQMLIRRPAAGGTPCSDWTTASTLGAWYDMDSQGDQTPPNENFPGTGVFTDQGTNVLETTSPTPMEGTGSVNFPTASDHLECNSTGVDTQPCEGMGHGDAVTVGGWIYKEGEGTTRVWDGAEAGGSEGFRISVNASEEVIVIAGSTMIACSSPTVTLSNWTHVLYSRADGNVAGDMYIDGAECTYSTETAFDAGEIVSSARPTMSTSGGSENMDGNLDEMQFWNVDLSAAEVCKICSCLIDGSLCTGTGASYDDSGRNSSECGSCTLAACNAADPT